MTRSPRSVSRQTVLLLLAAAFVLPVMGPGAATASDPQTRQQAALEFELVGVESAFGPETYKEDDRFNTRNPSDLENQTTNWANALGHRISFLVRITSGETALTCEDRFAAETYIDHADGRLWGWTNGTYRTEPPTGLGDVCTGGLPGVRTYNVTFDLDGAPPAVQPGVRYPALAPGTYTAVLNLYHQDDPSPTNPTGVGPLAGTFEIVFHVAEPSLQPAEPFQLFPEDALRLFSDAGTAGWAFPDRFQMVPRPLASNASMDLTVGFPQAPVGAQFERVDHVALRTGSDLVDPGDPPNTLPPLQSLDDRLENLDERGTVRVNRIPYTLSNDTVPASRQVLMTLRGADFATGSSASVAAYHPLHVVTIHLPATLETMTTGAASFVAAVSDMTFPVRGFTVDTGVAGVTGTTRLTLQDPTRVAGGTTGNNAGDLFALTDTDHSVIAQSRLARDTNSDWIRGSIAHTAFDNTPSYTMLAMLYGPSDEFLGMTTLRRGIDVQATALRTVEGRTESVTLTITNLGTDFDAVAAEREFDVVVRITTGAVFPDGSAYNHTTDPLSEGQSVTVEVPVQAAQPGDYNIVFTARSGELTETADSTVEVISKERYREENRKWYEIPAPPALLVVLALFALARLRRRE